MVTFQTVTVDGLVIRTAWDERHAGPVELHITIDHSARQAGRGIPQWFIHNLSLQSLTPASMKTPGSILTVGSWLEKNKPTPRKRVEDPTTFFAHVALFFVLVIESGEKGVSRLLANYAKVRPTMARQWIEKARQLGMLTENATRHHLGRAFGMLTDKARAILASGHLVTEGAVAA